MKCMMKFKINRDHFANGLAQVLNVVGSKATMPILSNVLIEAEKDQISLTTTNLDLGIRCKIKAEVKEHLDAENAYREAMMVSTLPLQDAMFEEMKGRIKEDDSSVPSPDGRWDYYSRYELGAEHPLHARRPRDRQDGEDGIAIADAAPGRHPHAFGDEIAVRQQDALGDAGGAAGKQDRGGIVGVSRRARGERVALVTARALSLPALICGTAGGMEVEAMGVCPATTALMAAAGW